MPAQTSWSSRTPLTRAECVAAAGLLACLLLAAALPPLSQPSAYHVFADGRSAGRVPNAANVLSNLAFVVAGLAIALGLTRTSARHLRIATRNALFVAAAGLIFTAAGSAYYHVSPNDATLFWDRMPLTIAFAGIIGAALAQRVTARAGTVAAMVLLALGPASLVYWRASANLMPYIVLQGGAMVALMLIVLLTRKHDDALPWWWVIAWYGIAKIAELFDVGIFNFTGGFVSGHTLKHLCAAVAAGGIAYPLWNPHRTGSE